MNPISLAENGFLPYWLLRFGIRQRVGQKLVIEKSKSPEERDRFARSLASSPIAQDTEAANEQHYEVPTAFYKLALGPHLKYSSAYWPEGCKSLAEAEAAALKLIEERVELSVGQSVLDLGCGWGSFSLWAAPRHPSSTFLAVSNSHTQATFIREEASRRGIKNLKVVTCDINEFDPKVQFDRIVSVEMLEHVRNYESLFARIASWMQDDCKMFVHVFSHRKYAYAYEADNPSEWMARHFFTGGIMPSHALLPSFDTHLELQQSWQLDGTHYQKTSDAWLDNMNRHQDEIHTLFEKTYGAENANRWMWRWRLFFIACAELFGYKNGSEWGVSHYILGKKINL
jgi:cyclopropane-fatty-acyl-phospholipid synthase